MARTAVAAAVIGAVLAGSATGLGLHAWRPDPFAGAAEPAPGSSAPSTPGGASGSPDPSPSPAPSSPSATRSTENSPSPSPSASPSPKASSSSSRSASPSPSRSPSPSHSASSSPASDPDPDFDRSALLRTTDFTAHGWAQARVTNSYPSLPQPPINPCAAITPGQVGLLEGNAGAWSSSHTTAQETVALFTDTTLADKEFNRLLNQIANCTNTNVRLAGFARTTSASGVDSIRWWNTLGPDAARGIIGVVRTDNRVAVLSISSPDSDPDDTHAGGTTEVGTLLGIVGQRIG